MSPRDRDGEETLTRTVQGPTARFGRLRTRRMRLAAVCLALAAANASGARVLEAADDPTDGRGLRADQADFQGRFAAIDALGRAIFELSVDAGDPAAASRASRESPPAPRGGPTDRSPDGGMGVLALPLDDLVRWGRFRDVSRAPLVWLADDSVLVCQQLARDGDDLAVDQRLIGSLRVPLNQVRLIAWQLPRDAQRRTQFVDRLLAESAEADRIVLANGDSLTGRIAEISPERLVVKSGAKSIALDVARMSAATFDAELLVSHSAQGQRVVVGLSDGSRLAATRLRSEGSTVVATLSGGLELRVPSEEIVGLQTFGGRTVYVSDLPATGYRHVPLIARERTYQRDRGTLGGELRVRGRSYLKGLGMHSASRITFELDRAYQSFEAELAIDDSAENGGSVSCRLFVDDGSGQWQSRYSSPVVRGGAAPLPVSVSLEGAKRISLIVDFAERGDERDHCDWLDARLVP